MVLAVFVDWHTLQIGEGEPTKLTPNEVFLFNALMLHRYRIITNNDLRSLGHPQPSNLHTHMARLVAKLRDGAGVDIFIKNPDNQIAGPHYMVNPNFEVVVPSRESSTYDDSSGEPDPSPDDAAEPDLLPDWPAETSVRLASGERREVTLPTRESRDNLTPFGPNIVIREGRRYVKLGPNLVFQQPNTAADFVELVYENGGFYVDDLLTILSLLGHDLDEDKLNEQLTAYTHFVNLHGSPEQKACWRDEPSHPSSDGGRRLLEGRSDPDLQWMYE